ncbi:probable serine/threonine-protein kinase PBL8 [Populus nigra]|uniref:probable serine/threonine-protein kinase PBL8 n=1 Tax=Populus nigra TaxID=3691 RepID=UPI002B2712FC|nr:probable serine/threonine-protein kinase PBL8 [Populus nigra]
MAISYLLLFIFMFLCNPHTSYTSACSLDFNKFPYEAHSECLGVANVKDSAMQSCCHSALQSLFQAMAIRANKSGSIFLELNEAQDCTKTFQNLHNRTNLSTCELQDFISSSKTPNLCSKDVDSLINLLGVERFGALQSNCNNLSTSNYNDDACYSSVMSFRSSLQALKQSGDSPNGEYCGEALLLSLSSTATDSANSIPRIFSCLWGEIGNLLESKKLLSAIIVAAIFVLLAPILYKLTRKQLQHARDKDIGENLSVLKKKQEEESVSYLNCCDLYVFSQDEVAKATNSFGNSNFIGEGVLGKTYIGMMPSGMRVAVKRLKEGVEVCHFLDEICEKAKIRHPNLVGIIGYCNKGDQSLVYEYCLNGDLATWLLGDRLTSILTWQKRMNISIGIARGLWYLHHNPLKKICHGDMKLTKILLNEKLEAKISDFNLSRYKSKEKTGQEKIANDVFNFGILLLQIMTGRKSASIAEARDAVLRKESLSDLADPRLNGAYDSAAFQNAMSIAVHCTNPSERERPNMEEVLQKLEQTQTQILVRTNCKDVIY